MTFKKATGSRIAATVCVLMTACSLCVIGQGKMPQTAKETVRGQGSLTTEQLQGTVEYVQGNTLVVKMADGNIREFNVPESRKFVIDGKELTVHDLKPGTKLRATVTTTVTPVTDRTTTVGTGTVWYVSAPNVILTLPNGENRMYKVADDYKFTVNGQPATVFDLRKGMIVSAAKIVEEPRTEIASNVAVTGQAPAPQAAKAAPAPAPRTEVAQTRPAPAPAPAATSSAAATQAPVEVAQAQPAPAELPKTASQIPLIGLIGLLMTGAALLLRRISRVKA